MKLRHYTIVLSVLTLLEIAILVLNSEGIPITTTSISQLGSMEGNYFFYFLSTSTLIIIFTLFLHKIYDELKSEPRPELYFIPFLSIIALFFRAQEYMTFGKIYHTVLFIAAALLALRVIEDLNTHLQRKTKKKKRIFTLPKIALIGTAALFIIIGINVLTEIFYMGTVLSWMHSVGTALSQHI